MAIIRARFSLGYLLFIGAAWGQQYVISTIAGGVPPPTPVAAAKASVGDPARVAVDAAGNAYFSGLHSVFKVDGGGILTRIAGNGQPGYSGDGGAATNAQLSLPMGIAVDGAGNVYVADRDASVVRKIAAGGVISTVAGTGVAGFSGDGGPAAAANLNGPFGLALDSGGNLYIADTNNNCIRKVSAGGSIATVAGGAAQGFSGDGGPARVAGLNNPEGIAVDAAGNLYIADTFNNRIRKVTTDGNIATVAGSGSEIYGGDNNPATVAGMGLPPDVAVDGSGNLYIADFGGSRIRQVTGGIIRTVAGSTNGAPPIDGQEAFNLRFNGPTGVAVDATGAFYFAEGSIGSGTGLARGVARIWKVSATAILTTLAGTGVQDFGGDGGPAAAAQLNTPTAIALDVQSNLYIADSLNHRIRKLAPGGTITTVAGTGVPGFAGEVGPPAGALLNTPEGVGVDGAGNLYIADTRNSRIRQVAPGGNIFTYAGNGNASYFGDGGPAIRAAVNQPEGVAIDAAGNGYIADTLDNAVRHVNNGTINTLAGFGPPGFSGDGGAATNARLDHPAAVAVDARGNVFVADTGNNRVRKIDLLGVITTVAGNGDTTFGGDGGPAASAGLSGPRGVAVDAAGNLYIADTGHNRIRKVTPDGTITTIAGNGTCCYSGDGGSAATAQLNVPWGLWVDGRGSLYVADSGNNAIRMLQPISLSQSIGAVTNAATNLTGPVAPGEIVVIYGSGLGPAQTVQFQVRGGQAGTQLAGTAVLFGGTAAPVLYTSATQVGAVVPYAVPGNSTQVVVQYQGLSTTPVTVPLAATAPGIFTADGTGRGGAAAINRDGSFNNSGNPAPAGSVVTFFATGEGATVPAGVDGSVTGTVLPRPLATVTATIGGVPAPVQFAGEAPNEVSGVMQVNLTVPANLPAGALPLVLTVGAASSQPGVTIAVGPASLQ
ncbi:MAG TPA: IPT/TIG domain-containing protein [Candidatus Acidoferrales bacterium]|nr:IPT/TIG domain-containing protein [Candidatus Acidoferrales bacterium]